MASSFPILSINITHDSDESDSTGNLNLLSLILGLFQTWVCIAIFGANSVFSSSEFISGFPSMPAEFFPVILYTFIITFSICLLILAFTNQLFLKFYVRRSALICATILATIGTYLVYATFMGETAGWLISLIAGIAMGAGASLITVLLGTAFSRYKFTTIILNTAIAIAISIIAYLVIVNWIAAPISGIITGLLPVIGSILLWRITPVPYYYRQEMPIFHPLPIKRPAFILRIGIPVVIFGFVLGALRYICLDNVLPTNDITLQLVAGVAACVSIAAVIATAIISKGDSYWDTIFRCLVPVIAIALFCIPFLESGTALLACFFLVIGYICFEMLMWFLFSDISQVFHLSPIFVFGLGRGLLEIASFVGLLLTQFFMNNASDGIFGSAESTAVLLLALVIAYALLPRQREIKTIVDPSAALDQTYATQQNKLGDQASIVNTNNREGALEQDPAEEEQKREKGRFRARCEEIGNTYMLSRRENEVLSLLAKGHNAAFIQDKLCISKSTAKTHINHIYRKLDIHTQQELLNMVEDRPHANSVDGTTDTTPTASGLMGQKPK